MVASEIQEISSCCSIAADGNSPLHVTFMEKTGQKKGCIKIVAANWYTPKKSSQSREKSLVMHALILRMSGIHG